jgi:hypothetical protein
MNELKEVLNAVQGDGISDERLNEIRGMYNVLGAVLDSLQSPDGLAGDVLRAANVFVELTEERALVAPLG